jgi:RNA recognition motif-containing protein
MKNIYVGNLAWECTSDELREMFAPFGQVSSAQIIIDRDTNRSRGFGFVEMANDEEASRAISELNGQMYKGRALTVNEAKPREPRPPRGGGGGRGGYGGDRY